MITSYTIWTSLKSYANTGQFGWYRPDSDFIAALNDISKKKWVEETGKAEKSQEVVDNLQPFLKSDNLVVKSSTAQYGLLSKPDDYGRFSSARIIVVNGECVECSDKNQMKTQEEITDEYFDNIEEYPVELINNQRWANCLKHLAKKPTLEKPKITEYNNGWKIAPRKVSVVGFDYYTNPKEATFKYTTAPGNTNTGAGDYLIYDTTSQPLEWPETMLNYFVMELGVRFSIFTRDQFLAAVTTAQQKQ